MPSTAREQQIPRLLLMLPLPRAIEVAIEDRFLPSIGASRPAMGYHISVVGPFYWAGDERRPALARLREACAEMSPLRIIAQGIDVFENGPDDCAVFVSVGPVARLQRLRRHALRALGDGAKMQYERLGPFRPHITLGLNLPSRVRDGLLKHATQPFRVQFPASELWLMEQRPQSPWQPLLAFALGTDAAPRALDVEQNDG